MATITFDRFDGGLDVRQLATSADANRLRVLKNAYVTTGRTIRKRAGLQKVGEIQKGTIGLFAGLGSLWTFSKYDMEHTNLKNVKHAKLDDPTNKGIKRIINVEVFNGFLYLSCEYNDGTTKHHYLDGKKTTLVEDVNCPHTPSFIKKGSKIYAIKDDVVRYSATSDARNWTAKEDAGFLPVSLQQSTSNRPTSLGEYQSNMVVFFEDSAQVWSIDPDPKLNRLLDTVFIGTRYDYSHANMGADIFFLSPAGFRSVAVQTYSTNLMDNDIGSPIDEIVKGDMRGEIKPRMFYYRGVGQLICFIGDYAYVYSYSRSSKISAWSIWTFPFQIDYVSEFETRLYVRSGDVIYVFDDLAHKDNGVAIPVVAELPFLDCRKPSVLKQFTGVDVAAKGTFEISFAFNPLLPSEYTPSMTLTDDTRPLPRIPVEVMSTNLGIRVEHNSEGPFELAGITVHYESMSEFSA